MKDGVMHKPVTVTRGAVLYAIVAMLLANITISVSGVAYTSRQQHESDKRWCRLLGDLDRPVDSRITDPNQRARTQATIARIHKLRIDLGCIE